MDRFSANAFINVLSTVEAYDMKRAYLSGKDFEARFFDENGNPLANQYVIFNIDNVNYASLTNSFGIARLNESLGVGDYQISILNSQSGEKIYRNLSIVKRIDENKDIVMNYNDGTYYSLRIYADNGEVALSQERVTFKIDSKTYVVKTDLDGIAKLALNFKSGVYTVTAEYRGVKVSNKITVKATYLIKAKNITKKKSKKVKFQASLKTSDGKICGFKKLTFKIKGKTYRAKTNSKGIATITIKNLKKGKYVIYTSFSNVKVKNRITIK